MSKAVQSQSVELGSVIAGTYQIAGILGRGGMGSVWEATHLRLPGKRVAIKVLHANIAEDPESLARFRREAEIACRLGHPNIVEVHDFNHLEDNSPYLVLEMLEGQSLDQRLRDGRIDLQTCQHIARQIGSALQCAHGQDVIHRDLKPQNIFLVPATSDGGLPTVKVLDFGISKIRGSQTVSSPKKPAADERDDDESLSKETTRLLAEAQNALSEDRPKDALFAAKRAYRAQPNDRSLIIQAKALCLNRHMGHVQAALRKLPKRKHAQIRKFCGDAGFPLP